MQYLIQTGKNDLFRLFVATFIASQTKKESIQV